MLSILLLFRYSLLRKACFAITLMIPLLLVDNYPARAETIIFTDTVDMKFTNWVDALAIPGFDVNRGTLLKVDLMFEGFLHGVVSYENTGVTSAMITATHAITVAIETLEGTILNTLPQNSRAEVVAAFDGTSDGQGPSGRTFVLTATQAITHTYLDPAILDQFIRQNELTFVVTATGNSLLSGPGNFDALLRAQAASALVTVQYTYRPPERHINPAFEFNKFTNGHDADQPNDLDVPLLTPGAPVTWTYLITNTGNISFALDEIQVTDDQVGVTPQFDPSSDDGDELLAPGEQWRFYATAIVQNLTINSLNVTVVNGCNFVIKNETLPTYRNIGTVTINTLQIIDASHYCNIPPTNLVEQISPLQSQKIFLPIIKWQRGVP